MSAQQITAIARHPRVRRRALVAWFGVLGLLSALTLRQYGCRGDRVGAQLAGETMGTSYSVKLGARLSDAEMAAVRSTIAGVLARIDALMSTYRDD